MKLSALAGVVLLSLASVVLVTGCSRERIDWKSAEAADTQEAYDHFLERHPDSQLATQARARLAQLAEEKDWQRASAADTADAYEQFLAQHGNGKWAEEARIRIENFTLDSNPSPTATLAGDTAGTASATPAAGAASVMHPAKPTPTVAQTSKPVTTASTAASSGYGIQLGAFSTQAAALGEWKRLQTTYGSELHGLFAHAVPVQVSSGTLFRLQSPVGQEAHARSICATLTKHAQPCVVVLPEKR